MTIVRSKTRVEVMFESAAPRPNGMTGSPEGLWLIDQHLDDAYLVDESGKVLRRIMTDSANSSGLAYGGGLLWVALNGGLRGRASRPNDREGFWILKVSPKTGNTLEVFQLPFEGRLHGLEWVRGNIWAARHEIKVMDLLDPKDWSVVRSFEVPYPRAHGVAWDGKGLWVAHPSDQLIAQYDAITGEQIDSYELPEGSPEPHGLTYWKNKLWYCDAKSDAVCTVYK